MKCQFEDFRGSRWEERRIGSIVLVGRPAGRPVGGSIALVGRLVCWSPGQSAGRSVLSISGQSVGRSVGCWVYQGDMASSNNKSVSRPFGGIDGGSEFRRGSDEYDRSAGHSLPGDPVGLICVIASGSFFHLHRHCRVVIFVIIVIMSLSVDSIGCYRNCHRN